MSITNVKQNQTSGIKSVPLISQLVLFIFFLVLFALISADVDLSSTFAKVLIIALPVLVAVGGLAAMLRTQTSTTIKIVFGVGTLLFLGGFISFLLPWKPTTINLAGSAAIFIGLIAAFISAAFTAFQK